MVQTPALGLIPAALALSITGCRHPMEGLGIHLNMDKKSMSNGLKVILVEDHSVPVVSYQTWFRVGSVDEKPGFTGLSHLFEHLMFKGTPKYGPRQFFLQLEAKGAEVNAYTTRDYTVYYENCTSDLLPKVVDMEADRMTHLQLDDDVLNTERQVVLEERRLRTDNSPGGRVQEALWGLAYRRHPYNWPVVGYPEDLMRLTVKDIIDYYQLHYQPGNAIIVVVGDFNSATLWPQLQAAYAGIPGHKQAARNPPAEWEQKEERRLDLYDQIAGERFAQAYHVTSADDDDSYALDVLANILFEGTSSRAYRRLVDEKDLMLGISGSAFTPTYPGLFMISGTMKGTHRNAEAEQELDQIISTLQEKGVTPAEIQVAVRQLTVQLVDSVRTPYGLGQLIGIVATVFGNPDRYADDLARYTRVTAADVQRVARTYLIPNNRSVVALLPESEKTQQKHEKKGANP